VIRDESAGDVDVIAHLTVSAFEYAEIRQETEQPTAEGWCWTTRLATTVSGPGAPGGTMDLVLEVLGAGVLGTVAMDLGNLVLARAGIISRIDVGMIGRMAAGWSRGRLRYRHPGEMEEVRNEKSVGYFTHFAIGVGFAVPYLLGWHVLVEGPAPPAWAIPYGVATTVASWFFVYPSMGLGALGRRSPDGLRAVVSPLANHFLYGLGLAAGIALL